MSSSIVEVFPEDWKVEFLEGTEGQDDVQCVRVTQPDGFHVTFVPGVSPSGKVAALVYELVRCVATVAQSSILASQLVNKMQGGKRLSPATLQSLGRFLNSAAGDGLVCGGVDANTIFLEIFDDPEHWPSHSAGPQAPC